MVKKWYSTNSKGAGASPMPGYKRKCFSYYRPAYFPVGKVSNKGVRVCVVCYTGEKDTLVEYRFRYENEWGNAYRAATPTSMHSFLKDVLEMDNRNALGSGWSVVYVDGRAMLRYENPLHLTVDGYGSYIGGKYVGKMVENRRDELAVAWMYPKEVTAFEIASKVCLAFKDIRMNRDGHNYRMNSRNSTLSQIESFRKELAEHEHKYAEVCEEAADALNELSERFKVEIALP